MPEIWLRYGTTDVVLDIRFENLAGHVSPAAAAAGFAPMPEEQIKAALDSVPVTDNMLILALSPSKAAARAVGAIAGAARAKGFAVTVDVPARFASSLRAQLTPQQHEEGGEAGRQQQQQQAAAATVSVNRIDYQQQSSFPDRLSKFQSVVTVSQVAYDPLFGFAGAPTALVRTFYPDRMAEAFAARTGNMPAPGVQGEPLKVALATAADSLDGAEAAAAAGRPAVTSIEMVASSAGIAGVHVGGSVGESFSKAVDQLRSISAIDCERTRSLIVSASGEPGVHSTLAGALNSLWNCVHAAREGGTAVLLAECREGLGGGALQAFVEGRLRPEQAMLPPPSPSSSSSYVEGLEHLVYMHELKQRYELGLVSSLPNYYATKLGFTTYTGVKDAHEKLLARHGRGHKGLVVSDADVVALRTAA